jgi:zinc transporter ZupT
MPCDVAPIQPNHPGADSRSASLGRGCYSGCLAVLWTTSGIAAPAFATAVGMAGAVLGVRLTGMRKRARPMVPLAAGMLLGVALFGLLPELAQAIGWATSLLLFGAGYGLLVLLARSGHSVCPACSHDHDHDSCNTELHGFAGPLLAAAALHSFLDGWSVAVAQWAAPLGLRLAVPLAIALHKAPEGIALGGILRAAVKSRSVALACAMLAEGTTLAGGALGLWLAPHLGAAWIAYPLGAAGGWLCYLGYHAVDEEWKRYGGRPAFLAAAAGMAGAALILRGAEALLR